MHRRTDRIEYWPTADLTKMTGDFVYATSMSTSMALPGLTYATSYTTLVYAENEFGRSTASSEFVATTAALAPAAPSNLRVTAAATTDSSVTIVWGAPQNGGSPIDRYEIQVMEGTRQLGDIQTPTGGNTVLTFTATGLNFATEFAFRVKAHNGVGDSTWSSLLIVTTSALPPQAPSGLRFGTITSTTAELLWQSPTNNGKIVTKWKLQHKTNGAQDSTAVETIGATTSAERIVGRQVTRTIGSLSAGTTYQVRIGALNSVGWGAWTDGWLTGTPCTSGEVSAVGTCAVCPSGSAPNADQSGCLPCAAGTFANTGEPTCASCETGAWSSTGAAGCVQCAPGKYGSAAARVNVNHCVACGVGKYSAALAANAESMCSTCPSGKVSSSSAGVASCPTVCEAGFKSNAEGSACVQCDAGTFSLANKASCSVCADGSAPNAGLTGCVQCAAGSFATSGSVECQLCLDGRWSSAGSSACTPCGPGHHGTSGAAKSSSSHCTACVVGRHSSAVGGSDSSVCNLCAAGPQTL